MKIKIKKLDERAVLPSYSKAGDAGMDLTAISVNMYPVTGEYESKSEGYHYIEYGTGLAIEIPKGFFGLVRPRSSVSKTALVFNTSGVVDSGFRGELTVRFKMTDFRTGKTPKIGERVAQLIILPYPTIELEEVDELSTTERGEGGYGSTGK